MNTFFKAASWDPLLKIITGGILLFAVAFILFSPGITTFLIMGGLIAIPPFFMVKGYRMQDRKLLIQRLGWTKVCDISDLRHAEYRGAAMKGSWRLLGNGGLFGWIGTFNNRALGTFRAYATNRNQCVVLELGNRTLLVTPEDPDIFVESLETLISNQD